MTDLGYPIYPQVCSKSAKLNNSPMVFRLQFYPESNRNVMEVSRFSTLLERQRPWLYALALRYTLDAVEAIVLTQDTISKAYMKRHLFEENSNHKAWLKTVMRNLFFNHRRVNRRRREIRNGLPELNRPRYARNEGYQELLVHDVLVSVAALPDKLRRPIDLLMSGYSYQEISEREAAPLGTIKSRIYAARKLLRKSCYP